MRKLVTKLEAGSLKLDKEWRQENPFIVENNIVSGRASLPINEEYKGLRIFLKSAMSQ
ncbi:hypothetical protein KAX35_01925 [candidate division WOR-3 bacterium]|nr:hypothetical protein [candidate division WOR-3 bacterium]